MRKLTMQFVTCRSFVSKKGNNIVMVHGVITSEDEPYCVIGFTNDDFSDLSYGDEVSVLVNQWNGKTNIIRL